MQFVINSPYRRLQALFWFLSFWIVFMASAMRAEASSCPEIMSGLMDDENITAASMTLTVEEDYKDDWSAYIGTWTEHAREVRSLWESGKSYSFNREDALKDETLAEYLKQVEDQIVAIRCLADKVIDEKLIQELSEMETAAGGEAHPELDIFLVE